MPLLAAMVIVPGALFLNWIWGLFPLAVSFPAALVFMEALVTGDSRFIRFPFPFVMALGLEFICGLLSELGLSDDVGGLFWGIGF